MSLKVKQGWNVLLVVLVDQFAHDVLISSVRRKYFTGLKCFRCDLHGHFIGRYFNLYLKSYDKDCSRGWRLLHYPYLKSWFLCCQISLPFNPPYCVCIIILSCARMCAGPCFLLRVLHACMSCREGAKKAIGEAFSWRWNCQLYILTLDIFMPREARSFCRLITATVR